MKIRLFGLVAAVFALAAIPAVSQATHDHGKGKSQDKNGKHCDISRGFTVRGTLVGTVTVTDGRATSITINVTRANRHARNSGEIENGVLVVTNDPNNGFRVKLVDGTVPSANDKVKLVGKIPYTKKRCADDDTTLADRYGKPDIRKAVIKDADENAD